MSRIRHFYNSNPSYPKHVQKCPDFHECLTEEYPGIRQAGGGLTDGNNARSSTKVRCDDKDYFNGNDGRSNYKVTCACNYSKEMLPTNMEHPIFFF